MTQDFNQLQLENQERVWHHHCEFLQQEVLN